MKRRNFLKLFLLTPFIKYVKLYDNDIEHFKNKTYNVLKIPKKYRNSLADSIPCVKPLKYYKGMFKIKYIY